MQDCDVFGYIKCMKILEFYGIATSTDTKHDKCQLNAQEFIHWQVKDSNCRQESFEVEWPGWTFDYNRNGISVRTGPIHGAVQKGFPTSFQLRFSYHSHYLTLDDIQENGACTTRCNGNTIVQTGQMTSAQPWEDFANAPKISCHKTDDASTTFPSEWSIATSLYGHAGTTFEYAQPRWVCILMTDRYRKLTRVFRTSKTTDWHMAPLFLEIWVVQ